MPQSTNSRRILFRLMLFTLAGWVLWALGREDARSENEPAEHTPEPVRARNGFSKRRMATSLAFVTLFFAGAAFSAGAGDLVVGAVESSTEAAPADVTTDESQPADDPAADDPAPADPAPADPTPADDGSADQGSGDAGGQADDQSGGGADSGGQPSDDDAAPASGDEDGSSAGDPAGDGNDGNGDDDGANAGNGQDDQGQGGNDQGGSGGNQGGGSGPAAGPGTLSHAGDAEHQASAPVDVDNAHDSAVAAEAAGSWGTFWLRRTLPDPTPPARRLNPEFARSLVAVAKAHDVDWALVLGVLRARGHRSTTPASRHDLVLLSTHLHRLHAGRNDWQAVLGLEGRTAFADRAIALARYNRAVGLWALVHGLVAAKSHLQDVVLDDSRIDIYAGGRSDISSGRVDVRVLALLRYMAEAHGQVTVSCLISGHRLYARPGVISAHIYGLAVDISALGGVSIYGNQEPGGLTEKAVRNILLLPAELRPRQIISLLGLGGPSFALADHYDHIHVGY
jgi:hypothetical protein